MSVSGSRRLPLEELVWCGISVKPAGLEERGACAAWPAGTSSPDFIVTHLTDQPFPVISLKLLSQVQWCPGAMAPDSCQILALCYHLGYKVGYSDRKEDTMLGQNSYVTFLLL